MIPELGHGALIFALIVALVQALLPSYGLIRGDRRAIASATSAAHAQFALVLLSYLCLSWAFYANDFSVAYVAQNSHSELPLMYRLAAVWGAHEGSLMLWMLMLSGWTLAVARYHHRLPADVAAIVLATLGAVSTAFMLFILFTSNPFERLFPAAVEGRDLNPLLQDPGLVFHPPMLYLGYVGFSVAFAFAIAALVTGRLDTAWARWTRPWTTAAWLCLTIGITLGSWWAYHELGWGGWWFWDPVENASFMPWLVGTALIHSLAVTEKRGLFKSWTVLLAILAFALSLLGTFLVRSGVLVSVHAFASDPARGVFILGFMTLLIGSALLLYAWRAPKLATDAPMRMYSREGFLLLNNVFLTAAAAAVFIGTLYPLFADALNAGKVSVGPPYFNAVFAPLTLPLAFLVGLAAVVPWKRGDWRESLRRLRGIAVAALVVGALLPWAVYDRASLGACLGTGLAVWAMLGAVHEIWRRARSGHGISSITPAIWGMSLAHVGLGVFVLGVTIVSSYSLERDVRLGPGEETELSGYRFRFDGVVESQGPNYVADTGTIRISRNDREIAVLHPEKRLYRVQRNVMTDADVDHSPIRDLYASLGEPLTDDPSGEWALRLYYKPMMRLVWGGASLMAIGGLLAIADRRYRTVSAAQRKAVAALAGARA
ncbi:MAG: heme lyase CcmF/NrfE family subunit [Pseudomonadota bacterium]|nr:heme lyase CcmF/NrfE family subunit [Pseudomonadota bacterium]